MPAVAFVSPKGGAGKTTAALLLALGLAERGETVAVIDSDPNKPFVHWAALPGKPPGISVHPAPTLHDVRDALREATRRQPDWIILDTEGSIRGAMVFAAMPLNLILTPLAGSQLEAHQALKAAEIVAEFGSRARSPKHRALLTRVPAAIRPRGLKAVVDHIRDRDMVFLDTPLFEKEAFRALFAIGGGWDNVAAAGVGGVPAARENAMAYVEAVVDCVAQDGR